MTPLSILFTAAKERAKLLKKEKQATWVAKNREVVNENKRRWREKRKS
jgi:hypothetical protein